MNRRDYHTRVRMIEMARLKNKLKFVSRYSLIAFAPELLLAQGAGAALSPDQIVEKVYPSVALILTASAPSHDGGAQQASSLGTGVVVSRNGIVLTAYHVVKNAYAVQVRFKGGEVFDQVQLLGVDARRDVAAIKITARGLPAIPIASAAESQPGEAVTVISHPSALPWSTSTGVIAAYRLAEEVPGAGAGYRLLQFTAATSPGSSGGLLMNAHGSALGLIVGSLNTGQNLNFAIPLENVVGLAEAPPVRTFADGSQLQLPTMAAAKVGAVAEAPATFPQPVWEARPADAELSDLLSASKDRNYILHNFRTMYVEAHRAQYFGSDQLKAALGRNKDFTKLNIRIVDDPKVADTILDVGYTFAWDFPFELRHQNTSTVLLSGKGVGPFSGPAGAASVASEFVKAAMPFRVPPTKK